MEYLCSCRVGTHLLSKVPQREVHLSCRIMWETTQDGLSFIISGKHAQEIPCQHICQEAGEYDGKEARQNMCCIRKKAACDPGQAVCSSGVHRRLAPGRQLLFH